MGIEKNGHKHFNTKKTINKVSSENSSINNEGILFELLLHAAFLLN